MVLKREHFGKQIKNTWQVSKFGLEKDGGYLDRARVR